MKVILKTNKNMKEKRHLNTWTDRLPTKLFRCSSYYLGTVSFAVSSGSEFIIFPVSVSVLLVISCLFWIGLCSMHKPKSPYSDKIPINFNGSGSCVKAWRILMAIKGRHYIEHKASLFALKHGDSYVLKTTALSKHCKISLNLNSFSSLYLLFQELHLSLSIHVHVVTSVMLAWLWECVFFMRLWAALFSFF